MIIVGVRDKDTKRDLQGTIRDIVKDGIFKRATTTDSVVLRGEG